MNSGRNGTTVAMSAVMFALLCDGSTGASDSADVTAPTAARIERVSAGPVLVAEDHPALELSPGKRTGTLTSAESQGAVRVSLAVSVGGVPPTDPSNWPAGIDLHVMKSSRQDGGYAHLMTASGDWIRSSLPSFPRHRRGRWRGGITLLDRDVEPRQTVWYRCELRSKDDGRAIHATGPCSTTALRLPPHELRIAEDGHAVLTWKGLETEEVGELLGLQCAVHYGPWFGGWFPCAAGAFRIPVHSDIAVPGDGAVQFALIARIMQSSWTRLEGVTREAKPVVLKSVVPPPPGRADIFAQSAGTPAMISTIVDWTTPLSRLYGRRHVLLHWDRPKRAAALTFTVSAPSTGTLPFLPQNGRSDRCEIQPGISEPLRFQLAWTDAEEQRRSVSLRLARPPALRHFRAVEGDGEVRLEWEPVEVDADDWLDGPWLTVHRMRETDLSTGLGRQWTSEDAVTELCRVRPTACRWVDRNVVNNEAYIYSLALHGILRATTQLDDQPPFDHCVPTDFRFTPADEERRHQLRVRQGIVAVPHAPRPLRVGIREPNSGAVTDWSTAMLERLVRERWLECVERTADANLYEESELRSFTVNADTGPANVFRPADAFLSVRRRPVGLGWNVDIWLEDVKSGWYGRVCTSPEDAAPDERDRALEAVLETLRSRWPTAMAPAVVSDADRPGRDVVLAIRPLATFGGPAAAAFPPGSLEDLLQVELSQAGYTVVDRARLQDALDELATTDLGASDARLRSSQMLGADFAIMGWLGGTEQTVSLVLRAVDARSGRIAGVWRLTADADSAQSLLSQAAGALRRLVRATSPSSAESLIWRRLDAAMTRAPQHWGYGRLATSDRLAPASAYNLLELSRFCRSMGETRRAELLLEQGLARTERTSSLKSLFQALSGILRTEGRWKENAALWTRAARRVGRESWVYMCLAESLLQVGRMQEARGALGAIHTAGYRKGRAYEELGLRADALTAFLGGFLSGTDPLDTYTPSHAFPPEPYKCLAAVDRLLQDASSEERTQILRAFALLREPARVHHVIRASKLLDEAGKGTVLNYWHGAISAVCVGDWARAVRWAARVLAAAPDLSLPDCISAREIGRLRRLPDKYTAVTFAERLEKAIRQATEAGVRLSRSECLSRARRLAKETDTAVPERRRRRPGPPASFWLSATSEEALMRRHPQHRPPAGQPRVNRPFYQVDDRGHLLRLDGVPDPDGLPRRKLTQTWHCDLMPVQRLSSLRDVPFSQIAADRVPALVLQGSVFAAIPHEGVLHAVNTENGEVSWRFAPWTAISQPVARRGQIVAALGSGGLLLLNPATGSEIRRVPYPSGLEECFFHTPAVTYNHDTDRIQFLERPGRSPRYEVTGADLSVVRIWPCSSPSPTQWAELSDKEKRERLKHGLSPDHGGNTLMPLWLQIIRNRRESETARAAAIKRVGDFMERVPWPEAIDGLRSVAEDSTESEGLRYAALHFLTKSCGEAVSGVLLAAAGDPHPKLATWALRRLAERDGPLLEEGLKLYAAQYAIQWPQSDANAQAESQVSSETAFFRKLLLARTARTGVLVDHLGWTLEAVESEFAAFVSRSGRRPDSGEIAEHASTAAILRLGSTAANQYLADHFWLQLADAQGPTGTSEWNWSREHVSPGSPERDLLVDRQKKLLPLLQRVPDPRFRHAVETICEQELEERWHAGPGTSRRNILTPVFNVLRDMGNPKSIPLLIRALPVANAYREETEALFTALETLTGVSAGSADAWWLWYVENYGTPGGPGDVDRARKLGIGRMSH